MTAPDDGARVVDGMRRIVRALRLAEQRTRTESGLSAAQLFVLSQLAGSEAASLTELSARTMTDRTSVAAILARLEEAGLAASERSAEDRRRVMARITAAGRRTLQRSGPAPTSLLVEALGVMPATRRRALAAHLEALVSAMGLADEPAVMLFEDSPSRITR